MGAREIRRSSRVVERLRVIEEYQRSVSGERVLDGWGVWLRPLPARRCMRP